jgi:hypothetical protein
MLLSLAVATASVVKLRPMIECYNASPEEIIQAIRDRALRMRQSAARANLAVARSGQALAIPGGGGMNLPEELSRVLTVCSETQRQVGKVNPRRPGFVNDLIQRAKTFMQRLLGWYTRSFDPFHTAVIESLYSMALSEQELRSHLAAMEQRLGEAQSEENLTESRRAQDQMIGELYREIDELSERLRRSELRIEQLTSSAVPGEHAKPTITDLPK